MMNIALCLERVGLTYHGMFDISINPSLLCVYADLDCIIDTPGSRRQ